MKDNILMKILSVFYDNLIINYIEQQFNIVCTKTFYFLNRINFFGI